MRTVRTKVYKFDELNVEAKQAAIDWYREEIVGKDDLLLFFFKETCQEKAKERGFFDIELRYSFSYSQGDGLSFSAGSIDLERFIYEAISGVKNSVKKVLLEHLTIHITKNTGHYAYCSASDVETEFEYDKNLDYKNVRGLVKKVGDYVTDVYLALCKEFENDGYEEIELANSDEVISENIRCNEYEFTQDGKIFNK